MAEHVAGGVNRSPPETPTMKGDSDEDEDELFHFEREICFHDDEPPEPKKTESEASVHGGNAFAALVGSMNEGGAVSLPGGALLISARPTKRRLSRHSFMLHVIAEDE